MIEMPRPVLNLCSFETETGTEDEIGRHDKGVKCVEWLAERQLLASSSWDETLKVWDMKAPPVRFCPM